MSLLFRRWSCSVLSSSYPIQSRFSKIIFIHLSRDTIRKSQDRRGNVIVGDSRNRGCFIRTRYGGSSCSRGAGRRSSTLEAGTNVSNIYSMIAHLLGVHACATYWPSWRYVSQRASYWLGPVLDWTWDGELLEVTEGRLGLLRRSILCGNRWGLAYWPKAASSGFGCREASSPQSDRAFIHLWLLLVGILFGLDWDVIYLIVISNGDLYIFGEWSWWSLYRPVS